MTASPNIVRRLVNGVWRTVEADVPSDGGGGGGLPFARNVYQAEFDFSETVAAADNLKKLAVGFGDGDETMVDLTDPTYPLIVTAGVYAFTVRANASEGGAGGSLGLLVDDNYYSITARGPEVNAGGHEAVCVVWWCDEGDPFAVLASSGSGGGATQEWIGALYVQRLA